MNTNPGWYFWQVCGWYGVYSKYHWLAPASTGEGTARTWHARTACGRSVYPEAGGVFVADRHGESKGRRCKTCERVRQAQK